MKSIRITVGRFEKCRVGVSMHPGLRDTASLRRSVEHSKMKEARIALKCEASEVGKI